MVSLILITINNGVNYPIIGAGPFGKEQITPGSFAGLTDEAHTEDFYLEFSRHPALRDFVSRLKGWGDDTKLLPRCLLRNHTPHNNAIGVHYDQSLLRYGEPTSVAAWVPIGDISLQGGGLIYLEGSECSSKALNIHKLTVKGDTLGRTLEDAFNKKARECGMTEEERINAFNKNMTSSGFLELGPIKFLQDNGGGRWLLTEYQAGDVVFHKPHMVRAFDTEMKLCLIFYRFMLQLLIRILSTEFDSERI
jgi:hypothetical protein